MTIRQRVKILPGGTIEIHDPQLPDGAEAEVLITVEGPEEAPDYDDSARPIWEEVLEIGASVPPEAWAKVPTDPPLVSFIGKGKGCFADAAEVDSFLRSERETWDR